MKNNNPNVTHLEQIYQIRADNLCRIADSMKNDATLARLLGIAPSNFTRLIRTRDLPFTEKKARAIEAALNKSPGFLDSFILQHKVPIYLLEDVNERDSIKPLDYKDYITEIDDAYFVKVLSNKYSPEINVNSWVLINPNETTPIENNLYVISYYIDNVFSHPVIRRYENDSWVSLHDKAREMINGYHVLGRCELTLTEI